MSTRICPTCDSSFILPDDCHAICEGCLRQDHAMVALTADDSCRPCKRLALKERLRRAELFMEQDVWFDLTDPVPLDELVDFGLAPVLTMTTTMKMRAED